MTLLNFFITSIIIFILFGFFVYIIVLIRESIPQVSMSRDIERMRKSIKNEELIPDVDQFEKIHKFALEIFPSDDDVNRWFDSPNPALGKRTPLDVLSEDKIPGLIKVSQLLVDLEGGLPTTRFQTIHRSIDQIGFIILV